jgi:hypothetical protein
MQSAKEATAHQSKSNESQLRILLTNSVLAHDFQINPFLFDEVIRGSVAQRADEILKQDLMPYPFVPHCRNFVAGLAIGNGRCR